MSLAPSLGSLDEGKPGPGRRRRSLAPSSSKANIASGKAKEAVTKRRSLAAPIKKDLTTPKKRSKKVPVVDVVEENDEEEFIFDPTPSRTITPAKTKSKAAQSPKKETTKIEAVKVGNFYSSSPGPIKKKEPQVSLTVSPKKASVQASPTKKFSKNSSRILTEEDIEARLMAEFDSPPPEARIQPKTFETDIPEEKLKPRRREVMIKSPVVKAAKKIEKKSKIPVKSPPMTPIKGTFVPQILPVGSPIIKSILGEIKKVEVRLSPHRIKEDPNVIFSLLEEQHDNKDRVQRVVQTLVSRSQEKRAKTRKSFEKKEKPKEPEPSTPLEKKPKKKIVSGTIVPPVENTVHTPKSTNVNRIKKESKQTSAKTTKTTKSSETPKSKKVSAPSKLNVSVTSSSSTVSDTAALAKKKVGQVKMGTEEVLTKKTTTKMDKENATPKGTKRPLEKTPTPSNKKLRTAEPTPKVTPKLATPKSQKEKPKLSEAKKKTSKATLLKSGGKKTTPGGREPLSAVKKPLKRLNKAAAVTPAQVYRYCLPVTIVFQNNTFETFANLLERKTSR